MGKKGSARENHLRAARERKQRETWIVPMDAMVSHPDGKTDKKGNPIMVPDPRRGTALPKQVARVKFRRREEQAAKIEEKRKQRVRFGSLDPDVKRAHREAGREHRLPADILKAVGR